ncbi:MAG: TIGR03086 family protein [Sciscionella sp.]|nr:TIGR03086 family protein [Sciscionella sp.]
MDPLTAHEKALAEFDSRVNVIKHEQWGARTACARWTVRDLLNHLVYEQLWVPHLLDGASVAEIGDRFEGNRLGDDPKHAWRDASTAARAAWVRPGALDRRVLLSRGATPAVDYLWEMTVDLAVHAWDLAVGIDGERTIDAELAAELLARVEPVVPRWQGMGIFDPPVPIADDASTQDKLLALLGRDPAR